MFAAASLVALREGLEMSLILGIIFSYLRKVGRPDSFRAVWLGTGLAALVAVAAGAVLYFLTGDEEWSGQPYLEATVFLMAVVVLSYMTFWMKHNSRTMGSEIGQRIDQALDQGATWHMVYLAFITVIREGIELVMFLLALLLQARGGLSVGSGAVLGLAVAIVIGWGIYRGTARINLGRFFTVMGNVLIVVAAGLLGNAIHELNEVSLLPEFGHIYDISAVLDDRGLVGGILHALVGYSDHPSFAQGIVWAAYLVLALLFFNRRGAAARRAPDAAAR